MSRFIYKEDKNMESDKMEKEKLYKYIRGEVSWDEKREITRWLEADPEHMKEYLTLRKLHDLSLWHEKKEEVSSMRNSAGTIKKVVLECLKIAAIVVITLVGIKYYSFSKDNEYQTYYTPEGQRAELQLSDGTRVWLNANSRLTYPVRFGAKNRIVTLEGEAFFSVTRNESNPFIVQAKGYNVEALGTEFNVIAYNHSDFFETSLLKGEVMVTTPSRERVALKPKMRVYSKDGKNYKGMIANIDHFMWKDGIMSFNHETVNEIFAKLELYYNIKIEVYNKELLNYKFTGKFRTIDGVEHILKVLQLRHRFTYQNVVDKKIIIIK